MESLDEHLEKLTGYVFDNDKLVIRIINIKAKIDKCTHMYVCVYILHANDKLKFNKLNFNFF